MPRHLVISISVVDMMSFEEGAGVLTSDAWMVLDSRASTLRVKVLSLRLKCRLSSASLLHQRELLVIDEDGIVFARTLSDDLAASLFVDIQTIQLLWPVARVSNLGLSLQA